MSVEQLELFVFNTLLHGDYKPMVTISVQHKFVLPLVVKHYLLFLLVMVFV